MKVRYKKYELLFKKPAGTSRGIYKQRTVWFLILYENGKSGIGECAPLPGLSKETPEQVEFFLNKISSNPETYINQPSQLNKVSSVKFALETALLDIKSGGKQIIFPSEFTNGEKGILINGLIWMGDFNTMKAQIDEKINTGFNCIKLKVGAINFEDEKKLLQSIRQKYSDELLTLRVDANGAFSPEEAPLKLEEFAKLNIHSIEQPIAAGKWEEMSNLCENSPIPIALDEELIGINERVKKEELLDTIMPQFLILKPSLHGGISGCDEWIELANNRNIDWWITSYLESNIGLNAISQWAFTKNKKIPQGLGTGQLFINNIDSPLEIKKEKLWYNSKQNFDLESIL